MRDFVPPPKGVDVHTLQILNHVINAERCDRPKDSALHKKTKTKTQFKREFLKSEDVPGQKDNLERLPGASVCLFYCELLFRSLL